MRLHLTLGIALAGACLSTLPAGLAFASTTSKQTFPEIVRISYLEGDVRVSRGQQGGAPKNTDWEKAVAGLPIEAGFSLATDDGRAEIEFEDASMVYLAPHSVLIFNDLESTGDVPRTEIALLTGTATIQVHPRKRDEVFILRTPTDTMATMNGQRADMRVTSYMDAIGLTPMVGGFVQVSPNIVQAAIPGHTHYYRSGAQVAFTDPEGEAALKDWDKWVANRMTSRDVAMAKMLKTTGLKEPVPGLAQLDGQGKFVDCPGYGTCWEPPAPPAPKEKKLHDGDSNNMSSLLQPEQPADTTPGAKPKVKKSYTYSPTSGGLNYYDASMYFPCGPDAMYSGLAMQANYNMAMMGAYGYGYGYYGSSLSPWGWAVCHSGSWLYQGNRYLWVPGGSVMHFPPVHWVRHGGTVGFIPIHPHDVNGKPPLNGTHGIIALGDKQGRSFAHVNIEPGSELKVLNNAPREFRKPVEPTLSRTDAPRMEAHMFKPEGHGFNDPRKGAEGGPASNAHVSSGRLERAAGGRENAGAAGFTGPRSGAHVVGVPIVFDHNSQSFLMSREVPSGHNMRTINEPVDNYLARSGQSFGGPQGGPIGRPGGSGNGFDNGGVGVSSGRGIFPGGGNSAGGGGFNPSPGGGGLTAGGNASGNGPGVSTGGGLSGGGSFGGGGGGGMSPSHGGGSAPAPAPSPH